MSALEDFCQQLHDHFQSLAMLRGEAGAQLYALEHPFSFEDLREVERLLALSCKKEGLAQAYRLAWIVLATECGYEYSGVQYWPMIEKRIAAWQFRHRDLLRGFFESFAGKFRGARPAGVWAQHFNVIAWPITNAILPRDLQVSLSHSVYLARYYLGRTSDRTDAEVGRIVAEHAHAHGDRFSRFLNQHEFVGSLVKQLLHLDAAPNLFEERTFRRIVADLEGHAEARYWLKEARSQVKPKIRIATNSTSATLTGGDGPRLSAALSPSLVMRVEEDGRWGLHIQPPSLIQFLQEHPGLASQVAQCRYSVLGNSTQLFQLRDLLNASPRERPILAFPSVGEPLLACHPSTAPFAHQLRTESVLAPRSIWAFRLRKDGAAWLQSTPVVSPGNTYLLAQQMSEAGHLPGVLQESVYETLRLVKFEVPRTLTDQDAERFKELGLSVRRRTTVSAWGVLPRRWNDGESAEYVEGDPIYLRVERDHAFDTLRCSIGSEKQIEVSWPDAGDLTLEIKDLPSGEHEVRIDTCRTIKAGGCTSWMTLSSATIRLRIRPPSAWLPDKIPHEALAIHLNPAEPTLEEILKGAAQLSVRGQADWPVHVELVLADDQGESRHSVLRRKPPIDESDWKSRLESILSKDDDLAVRALGADRGHLSVSCERFGLHRLAVGIFPEPIRWVPNREDAQRVRLRIRCDGVDAPTVVHYPFDDPGTEHDVRFEDISRGIDSANGLYVASGYDGTTRLVVSSPPRALHGLGALRAVTTPRFSSNMPADRMLEAYRRWARAPAIGKLADVRRESVVVALHSQLVSLIAGQDWARLETKSIETSQFSALDERVAPKTRNYGIALAMRSGLKSEDELFEAFRAASTNFKISTNLDLIQLAWLLAFDPAKIPPELDLLAATTDSALAGLTRGARLLKLHYDRRGAA